MNADERRYKYSQLSTSAFIRVYPRLALLLFASRRICVRSLLARFIVIAWLKLLRLPNVFTAVADVMMGYLVTHGNLQPTSQLALLIAASCLLYLSGMVLNDVFDIEVDSRDRPQRPIPSGGVSLRVASAIGWAMLASGVLLGWFTSFAASDWRPGAVASLLAGCIVLYDGVLKRTPIAPLLMGACRALNVFLGMSLAPLAAEVASAKVEWAGWAAWLIAAGLAVYVAGVTIFARTEARASTRSRLVLGFIVLLVGIGLLATTPAISEFRPPIIVRPGGWYLLWGVLALITARRCVLAILRPTPENVQAAVRHCVQTIIVLDAAVCVGYAGPMWGLAVILLLVPTLLLTLYLDAT
jgi:4-hydroxybenzoate polyprenyltransferase